mmetsp:Transcript_4999/g.9923  ORF Transcript_4999/g.9923 Transcript_4999/m.9923 type:complete len:93 (+) Transcript_4999:1279-1557(+)
MDRYCVRVSSTSCAGAHGACARTQKFVVVVAVVQNFDMWHAHTILIVDDNACTCAVQCRLQSKSCWRRRKRHFLSLNRPIASAYDPMRPQNS